MVWRNIVNGVIGIWFIISPYVLGYTGDAGRTWTSIIGGIILLVLAGSAAFNGRVRQQSWIQYVDGLVGIWFIIAPWVLLFTTKRADFWTSLVLGIIALILSAWSLDALPRTRDVPGTGTQQHAH